MKLMTKSIEEKLSHKPLYSTEGQGLDAECVVKYFNPCGSYTFFATEGEKQPDGDWLLFGLCYNHELEWGYALLSELESVKLPFGLGIERDLYSSGTVRELTNQLGIDISSISAHPEQEIDEPSELSESSPDDDER